MTGNCVFTMTHDGKQASLSIIQPQTTPQAPLHHPGTVGPWDHDHVCDTCNMNRLLSQIAPDT